MSAPVAPPGWPAAVRAPGAPDWEHTAVAWLLDACPADYRGYPLLSRHPLVLAHLALLHVEAQQAATRRGLSEARAGLSGLVDHGVVDEVVQTLLAEDARLVRVRREVGLVEEAVLGRRFVARL